MRWRGKKKHPNHHILYYYHTPRMCVYEPYGRSVSLMTFCPWAIKHKTATRKKKKPKFLKYWITNREERDLYRELLVLIGAVLPARFTGSVKLMHFQLSFRWWLVICVGSLDHQNERTNERNEWWGLGWNWHVHHSGPVSASTRQKSDDDETRSLTASVIRFINLMLHIFQWLLQDNKRLRVAQSQVPTSVGIVKWCWLEWLFFMIACTVHILVIAPFCAPIIRQQIQIDNNRTNGLWHR